ncbi:MAG: hypothetical protein WBP13_04695 [Methylophilaceae bacterium]
MITISQNARAQIVKPTIFPDGTSQIWQLALADFEASPVNIIWHFEQEAELVWVNQLISLLNAINIEIAELFIPYLPYARQDKAISNESTFAKQVFLNMLFTNKVNKISTLDVHSHDDVVSSYSPAVYIAQAIATFKPTVLVFPDASAYKRYAQVLDTSLFAVIVLDKVRNQATGQISALTLDTTNTTASLIEASVDLSILQSYQMLIIDDICDGGATFINAALYLHTHYQCQVALYVTHGIFSKGFEKMISAGISAFFTTQSLIKNVTGFALKALTSEL